MIDPRWAVTGVLALALFAGGMWAGLRWNAGEVADAERAQAAAEAERDKWREAAGSYQRATELWQRTVAANAGEAERQRKAREAELARLAREESAAAQRAEQWRQRFLRAQADPDCAQLMEATTCAVFSDY